MKRNPLPRAFFDHDPMIVAQALLGKIIHRKHQNIWLSARIIETEAYYLDDKASHSSLGYTDSRRALFMPPGTLYFYYARGKPSFNITCQGLGNAVLVKSAFPVGRPKTIACMQDAFITSTHPAPRPMHRLCSGQTLLCQALRLTVPEWNTKTFDLKVFFIGNDGRNPQKIIQTPRLGIPKGRDEHLPYRFIDSEFVAYCTKSG